MGHGGQRARTLELALFKHIKPFNIIFLSHPCFLQDIPINFVREWFFEDVDEVGLELALLVGLLGLLALLVADSQVLPRIWGNLTDLYSNGQGMFTLAV